MSEAQKLRALERRIRLQRHGNQAIRDLRRGKCSKELLAEMRLSILKQDCPFCGEPNFKSIAGHIFTIHGLRSQELRHLVFFTRTESICSAELATKLSELGEGKCPSKLGKYVGRRKVSEKGRLSMRLNALKGQLVITTESRRENGRKAGKSNIGRGSTKAKHGKYARYAYGCRCDPCMEGQRQHWRDWRLNRKSMETRV